MNNKKTKQKSRDFAFILYPESLCDDWLEKLKELDIPMAISPLHNQDEAEKEYNEMTEEEKKVIDNGGTVYKKEHYHVIYIAKNPVTTESVRNKIKRKLGNETIAKVVIVDSVKRYYDYLTHESSEAIKENKHQYNKDDIELIGGFNIDRYDTLDDYERKELKIKLLEVVKDNHIVNVIHLFDFLDNEEVESLKGVNISEIYETVTRNVSSFRLWFDGNYQDGYRRERVIDYETGEIME